jgi:uncharacterized membrane protein YphA (DoxX/SURF4 family)
MKQLTPIFVIGRIIVGGTFLWSGIANLLELNDRLAYGAAKGLGNPQLFIPIASLLLIIAGLSILTGIRPLVGIAAAVLFLIPVTLIMHNFWALSGLEQIIELHNFQGNAIMLGSVLMFGAIPRPWPMSLDESFMAKWRAVLGSKFRLA